MNYPLSVGRAFSPRPVGGRFLGRCPRLVWFRAVGPRNRVRLQPSIPIVSHQFPAFLDFFILPQMNTDETQMVELRVAASWGRAGRTKPKRSQIGAEGGCLMNGLILCKPFVCMGSWEFSKFGQASNGREKNYRTKPNNFCRESPSMFIDGHRRERLRPEHFQKYCSRAIDREVRAVFLSLSFVSAQSQGSFEPAPSPKADDRHRSPNPKIVAPNGGSFSSKALDKFQGEARH